VFYDFLNRVIYRFNGIGRIHHLPDFRRELENGMNSFHRFRQDLEIIGYMVSQMSGLFSLHGSFDQRLGKLLHDPLGSVKIALKTAKCGAFCKTCEITNRVIEQVQCSTEDFIRLQWY
jgi:hypothetical protein